MHAHAHTMEEPNSQLVWMLGSPLVKSPSDSCSFWQKWSEVGREVEIRLPIQHCSYWSHCLELHQEKTIHLSFYWASGKALVLMVIASTVHTCRHNCLHTVHLRIIFLLIGGAGGVSAAKTKIVQQWYRVNNYRDYIPLCVGTGGAGGSNLEPEPNWRCFWKEPAMS